MHVIIHFWHWLYQQVQLDIWFGNIVAGVVTWATLTGLWKWKVKGWVNEAVARHLTVHTEELKRHISAEHEKSRALNKPKPTRKPKDAPTD